MQLELTRAELELLLFIFKEQKATLRKGPDPFDFIVDEVGMELFEKLIALAESEGIDYGP